jgi:hypothetical protein
VFEETEAPSCPPGDYTVGGDVGTTTGQDEKGTYVKTCSWT